MGGSAHASYSVGALIVAGGAMGYAKAKSLPSLIAGTTLGGLLILSGVLISKGRDFEGHALALGASSILTAGMGFRALQTKKMMPAGMVAAIGLASAVYQGQKVKEWS